jgi:hypothetical protein
MDIRYGQIRLVQEVELSGSGYTITSEGTILTNGSFDFEVTAYDQSYALEVVGISIDASAVEVDVAESNAAEVGVFWTAQGQEYRVFGLTRPTAAPKLADLTSFDRESIIIPANAVKSAGQLSNIGYAGLPTVTQAEIDAPGTPVPRIIFMADDKAKRIEGLHGLRVRQTLGIPIPAAMQIAIAVRVIPNGQ